MTITLPWPPSENHYRRHVPSLRAPIISKEGRQYRQKVALALAYAKAGRLDGPLSVRIVASPPDRRRRDLDNLLKALLDALTHGGAYGDDSQIHKLAIEWGCVVKNGLVTVEVVTLEDAVRAAVATGEVGE